MLDELKIILVFMTSEHLKTGFSLVLPRAWKEKNIYIFCNKDGLHTDIVYIISIVAREFW